MLTTRSPCLTLCLYGTPSDLSLMTKSPSTSCVHCILLESPEMMFSFLRSSICSFSLGSCLPDWLHSKKTSPLSSAPFAKHKPLCYQGHFVKITTKTGGSKLRQFIKFRKSHVLVAQTPPGQSDIHRVTGSPGTVQPPCRTRHTSLLSLQGAWELCRLGHCVMDGRTPACKNEELEK